MPLSFWVCRPGYRRGRQTHPTDVGRALEHGDVESALPRRLRCAHHGESGTNDGNPHDLLQRIRTVPALTARGRGTARLQTGKVRYPARRGRALSTVKSATLFFLWGPKLQLSGLVSASHALRSARRDAREVSDECGDGLGRDATSTGPAPRCGLRSSPTRLAQQAGVRSVQLQMFGGPPGRWCGRHRTWTTGRRWPYPTAGAGEPLPRPDPPAPTTRSSGTPVGP